LLIGFIGAVLGFVLGTLVSFQLGPKIFKVTKIAITPDYMLLYWAILIGPFFAAMASLLPVLWAVNRDSAELLKE